VGESRRGIKNLLSRFFKTNKMYEIQEEQVRQLELLLQEIPLKFGLPILNLLNTHLTKQEETPKKK
jgi:hypothetical protein